MRNLLALLLAVSCIAQAEVFKCTNATGAVAFSAQPCGSGSSGGAIAVEPPALQAKPQARTGTSDEEIERQLNVEIPATERQAQQAIDSGDPRMAKIGRELAWQAHLQRQAIEEIKAAQAEQVKTHNRYKKALDDLQQR